MSWKSIGVKMMEASRLLFTCVCVLAVLYTLASIVIGIGFGMFRRDSDHK